MLDVTTYQRKITQAQGGTYFRNHLGYDRTLSQLLSKVYNAKPGKLFTFHHLETSSEIVANFESGGISKTKLPFKCFTEYIESFLRASSSHLCVFEEYMLRADSKFNSHEDRVLHTFGDEVYFILSASNLKNIDVERFAHATNYIFFFVCALTSLPENAQDLLLTRELQIDTLQALAQNASAIAVGAYDGEGYLIWESS